MVTATPDDAIFTKEDLAMYTGLVTDLMRDSEFNVTDWIKTQTDDPVKIQEFVDFINLRKTGAIRLDHKELMVNTIKEELLQLFAIKQNLHSAFASLPLPELVFTITVVGQPIEFSIKNLGYLKAEININIPGLGTIGFGSPHLTMKEWEEEIEELILSKQEYLNATLATPLLEIPLVEIE